MDTKLINVITYFETILEASRRFHSKQESLDSFDLNTIEWLYNRICPFIENPQIEYRVYHQQYLQLMMDNGWSYGKILDLRKKTAPDLKPYRGLSTAEKEEIAFRAGVTSSIIEFYKSLKQEIENEIMDQINHLVALRRVTN